MKKKSIKKNYIGYLDFFAFLRGSQFFMTFSMAERWL